MLLLKDINFQIIKIDKNLKENKEKEIYYRWIKNNKIIF